MSSSFLFIKSLINKAFYAIIMKLNEKGKNMDKVNELSKEQKSEEKILIAKAMDKYKFVEARNRFQNTDFLNLAEQMTLDKIIEMRRINNYIYWGGYEDAERKMLVFLPDDFEVDLKNVYDQCMCILRIDLPKEQYGEYEHKTYLGALMKLGLKREKIGDIIVRHDGADIIISREIEKFLKMNISDLTRFHKANIEIVPIDELKYVEPKKEIVKINVSSMRLDCLVAELARCSRNKAMEYIEQERVFVNFKEEIVGARQVQEDSYITIRGKGRFKILKIVGNTRKGRISVEIEK